MGVRSLQWWRHHDVHRSWNCHGYPASGLSRHARVLAVGARYYIQLARLINYPTSFFIFISNFNELWSKSWFVSLLWLGFINIKMLRKVRKQIRRLDTFGAEVKFNLCHRPTHQSTLGGVTTLCLSCVIAIVMITSSLSLLQKETYTVFWCHLQHHRFRAIKWLILTPHSTYWTIKSLCSASRSTKAPLPNGSMLSQSSRWFSGRCPTEPGSGRRESG